MLRRLVGLARSPLFRLAATGVGLSFLLRRLNVAQAAADLGRADPRLLALGVGLTALGLTSVVVGWRTVILASGARVPVTRLASWYLQGIFVGQFTPAGAGGDAVRALGATRAIGVGRGLASTMASRMATGLSMAIFGLLGALLAKVDFGIPVVIAAAAYLTAMIVIWWLALGLHDVSRWLGRQRNGVLAAVARATGPVTEALGRFRERPGALALCVGLALAGWLLNIFALQTFAAAVGIHQPPAIFAVAFPISLLATMAPIAVNGIGLREGVLIGLLAHLGESAAKSGALALLIDFQLLPFALLGAGLLLGARRHNTRGDGTRSDPPDPRPQGLSPLQG